VVSWSESPGSGVEYQVLRGTTQDSANATELSGCISGTTFADATAAAPSVETVNPGGCFSGPQTQVVFQYYYYWVRARLDDTCMSEASGGDRGHRGEAKGAAASDIAPAEQQSRPVTAGSDAATLACGMLGIVALGRVSRRRCPRRSAAGHASK